MRITRPMPSFEGVGAGQTATLRCPIGLTYHQILIDFGSTAGIGDFNALRVIANGEVIWNVSEFSRLDSMNQFDGRVAASNGPETGYDGILVIDFDRFNLKTIDAEEMTKLGTGGAVGPDNPNPIVNLSIEIDIDAGAAAVVLKALSVQSEQSPTGIIKKVKQFTYNPAAAGEFEISTLPKVGLINRIFLIEQTAAIDISRVRLERDAFVVFDRTLYQNNRLQLDGVRTPQANMYVIDPSEGGNGAEAMVTQGVNDLRLTLTVADAGIMPVVVEYLDVPKV